MAPPAETSRPLWLPLHQCTGQEALAGNKAAWLAAAHAHGLPVPPGAVLTTAFTEQYLAGLGLDLARRRKEIEAHPVRTGRILAEIRQAVLAGEFRSQLRAAVTGCLGELGVPGTGGAPDGGDVPGGSSSPDGCAAPDRARGDAHAQPVPLAVRGSSPLEDRPDASAPGVFASRMPVRGLSQVLDAVAEVIASVYSGRACYYFGGLPTTPTAVLLQPWLDGDHAGVLFTRHPLRPGLMLVESTDRGDDAVTAGHRGVHTAVVPRPGRPSDATPAQEREPASPARDSAPPAALLRSLVPLAERAEQVVHGRAADVEWVSLAGEPRVVQVRPVAGRPARGAGTEPVTVIDQTDDAVVRETALGSCGEIAVRARQKKLWARLLCRQLSVPTWQGWYVRHLPAAAEEAAQAVTERAATDCLRLDWGDGKPLYATAGQLPGLLREHSGRNNVDGYDTVHVGEVLHPAAAEGAASLTEDGHVLVEAFPPAVNQKDGRLTPTRYLLGPAGEVRSEQIAEFTAWGSVDPGRYHGEHGFLISRVDPRPLTLTPPQLARIATVSHGLRASLGPVSWEWTVHRDQVHFQDLSLESVALPDAPAGLPDDGLVLSPGQLTGRATLVRAAVFDRLAEGGALSVQSYDLEQDLAHQWEPVEDVRRHLAGLARPVVVASHPSIGLLPLVPYLSGMVFATGNVLCHLAIALRERGVPALVSGGLAAALREGDPVDVPLT